MSIEKQKSRSPALRCGAMVGGLLANAAIGLLMLIAVVPLGVCLLVSYVAPLIAEWAYGHDRH